MRMLRPIQLYLVRTTLLFQREIFIIKIITLQINTLVCMEDIQTLGWSQVIKLLMDLLPMFSFKIQTKNISSMEIQGFKYLFNQMALGIMGTKDMELMITCIVIAVLSTKMKYNLLTKM